MTSALLLLAVAVLVAANGFFVAAEFGLVRARRSRIEALAGEGATGAQLALRQIDRIDQYLSACQLGITMASLGIGFLGEPAIARLLEEPLGTYFSHAVAVAIAIAIAYLLVTVAHITVGEQVPKIYSIVHPERTARFVARPLHLFLLASRPLGWLLNSASNAMLRLVGVSPADFHEGPQSEQEIRHLISESAAGGSIEVTEAEMIRGVFDLHEREARQVMTPFHAVVTIASETTSGEALEKALESGHSRLVATKAGDEIQVVGTVHTNSLVSLLFEHGPTASVKSAVRPAHVVPETKSLDDLLSELREQRAHLAVVVSEYGVPAGIVTIEDIVEEIVGEIADEKETVPTPVRRLSDREWLVQGDLPLVDAHDFGIDLPTDEHGYTSVGGLVFDRLGREPRRGDSVAVNGYALTVESVERNRIALLRVRHDAAHPPTTNSSTSSL
ncbi:MAG: hemolysin family protein [Actinomycetota bacterium]|nr:hemolysin family protein [Actinomycetota bacterium]